MTHDHKFHVDDVFAAATLSLMMKKRNQPFKIIRTRDELVIKNADIVFDVGGIYDPTHYRFDHHQKEGAGTHQNGILYASFGLVWKHLGHEIVSNESVWQTIENSLVIPVDANDTGFDLTTPKIYGITEYSIGQIINDVFQEGINKDNQFGKAVEFTKVVLQKLIVKCLLKEEEKNAVVHAYEKSSDKRLIIIDEFVSRSSVWEAMMKYPEVLFAVYQGENHDRWQLTAMRNKLDSFGNRKNLPVEWAGLRDDAFQKITNVPDAIFCHRDLFTSFAKSKEGAIRLAHLALEN